MRRGNKGISAVVATVLIILITVAAVTIIWAAIIPMIKGNLDRGTVCLNAVQQLSIVNRGYTCFSNTAGSEEVRVQVAYGPTDVNLRGIQIIVSDNGGSTVRTYTEEVWSNLPTPNGQRVLQFNPYPSTTAENVKIAPIVGVGNGNQTCDASAPVDLKICN